MSFIQMGFMKSRNPAKDAYWAEVEKQRQAEISAERARQIEQAKANAVWESKYSEVERKAQQLNADNRPYAGSGDIAAAMLVVGNDAAAIRGWLSDRGMRVQSNYMDIAKASSNWVSAQKTKVRPKASASDIMGIARQVLASKHKFRMSGFGMGYVEDSDVNAVLNALDAQGYESDRDTVRSVLNSYLEVASSGATGSYAQGGSGTVVSGGEKPSLITTEFKLPTGGSTVPTTSPNAPATTNNLIDMYSGTLVTTPQTPLAEQIASINAAASASAPPPTAAASFAASGGAPGVYAPSPVARGLAKAKQFAKDRSPVVDAKTGEGSAGLGTLAVIGTILYMLGG